MWMKKEILEAMHEFRNAPTGEKNSVEGLREQFKKETGKDIDYKYWIPYFQWLEKKLCNAPTSDAAGRASGDEDFRNYVMGVIMHEFNIVDTFDSPEFIASMQAAKKVAEQVSEYSDSKELSKVWVEVPCSADQIEKEIYKHLNSLPYEGGYPSGWQETLAKHLFDTIGLPLQKINNDKLYTKSDIILFAAWLSSTTLVKDGLDAIDKEWIEKVGKGFNKFIELYPSFPKPQAEGAIPFELKRGKGENDFQYEMRKRKFEHVKTCDNERCKEILAEIMLEHEGATGEGSVTFTKDELYEHDRVLLEKAMKELCPNTQSLEDQITFLKKVVKNAEYGGF